MSNEIEIRITAENDTKAAFTAAEASAKRTGETMGENLVRGVDGRLRDARGRFVKLGDETGQGIGTGIGKAAARFSISTITEGMSSLGQSMAKSPHVLAAGTAVGMVLAPAIGAAVNSAMLVGAGGGVLAAGIAAAAQSPRVKNAFKAFKDSASEMFKDFGTPFIAPLERGIFTLRRGLDDISPSLNRMGASMAPLIDKLAPALLDMARNAMPGIERAVAASVPLFEKLAQHLPRLGAAIGDFFDSMADGAPGALKFFDFFLSTIESTVRGLGFAIEGMSRMFDIMARGMSGDFKGALESAAGYMMMLDEEAKKTAEGQQVFSGATKDAAGAAKKQAASLSDVIAKMTTLGRLTLTEREAQRGLIEALEEATASVNKNGRTLQIGTEKGRENARAIDSVADNYLRLAEAQARQDGNQRRANRTMREGADTAFFQAMRFGMSARAAFDYSRRLFGIPPTRQTLIQLANVERARGNVAGYRAILAQIPRLVTTTVRIQTSGAAHARSVVASMRNFGEFAHGGIKGAASGGLQGSWTWVGEQGPELVKLPPGSHVHPAGASKNMYSAAMEMLARVRGGGSFHEDFSWGSMSKNASAQNDRIADMFYASGHARGGFGGGNTRQRVMNFLSTFRPPGASPAAGVTPGSGGGGGHVVVTYDTAGAYDEFLRLLRKMVRVEGGGNVQRAFGRT